MTPSTLTQSTAGAERRTASQRTGERRAAVVLLTGIGAFQVALAAGAPWGAAAWSGANPGVLPDALRVASTVSAVVYAGLAVVTAGRVLGPAGRRRVLTGASALLVVGTLANLASPSMVEKLWAPVAAALAVLLWRTRAPVRGSR